jgi:hypothetical protein
MKIQNLRLVKSHSVDFDVIIKLLQFVSNDYKHLGIGIPGTDKNFTFSIFITNNHAMSWMVNSDSTHAMLFFDKK